MGEGGTKERMAQDPYFEWGPPQVYVSDPLPGAQPFVWLFFEYSRKFVNSETPEEHGKRPTRYIYTN